MVVFSQSALSSLSGFKFSYCCALVARKMKTQLWCHSNCNCITQNKVTRTRHGRYCRQLQRHCYLRQGGYVLPAVCLSVCLFVYLLTTSHNRIFMKIFTRDVDTIKCWNHPIWIMKNRNPRNFDFATLFIVKRPHPSPTCCRGLQRSGSIYSWWRHCPPHNKN